MVELSAKPERSESMGLRPSFGELEVDCIGVLVQGTLRGGMGRLELDLVESAEDAILRGKLTLIELASKPPVCVADIDPIEAHGASLSDCWINVRSNGSPLGRRVLQGPSLSSDFDRLNPYRHEAGHQLTMMWIIGTIEWERLFPTIVEAGVPKASHCVGFLVRLTE
jgi:hypothetical protein